MISLISRSFSSPRGFVLIPSICLEDHELWLRKSAMSAAVVDTCLEPAERAVESDVAWRGQMVGSMPSKIEFQVVWSTGEHEDFRATELNHRGPTARGWRSSANCTFPQEIILQLRVLAVLHQIQILAHQYLIPHKIEICTSTALSHDEPSHLFEYLGFITFSDNKLTAFRSRELKSIFIPSKTARYIKLRIHDNHANAKNVYNQVGLIAVSVLGEEMDAREVNNNSLHPPGTRPHGPPPSQHALPATPAHHAPYLSPFDDLAFEMSVDEETANILRVIECRMLQAVLEERPEYANALSMTIENLRAAGEILAVYEQEKRRAVSMEDFDRAKAKKLQIDHFREKIYAALRIDQLLDDTDFAGEYDFNSNADDNSTRSNDSTPLRRSPRRQPTSPSKPPRLSHSLSHPPPTIPDASPDQPPTPPHPSTPSRPPPPPAPRYKLTTSLSDHKIRPNPFTPLKTTFDAYDDRMLPALRSYHGNEVVRECQLALGQQRKTTLNDREKKQAMLPIAVFGTEMIEKFYSKSFSDKEEGLRQLQQALKAAVEDAAGGQPPPYNKLARAAVFLLHRGLRDTVYSVYTLAAETVRLFFSEFVPQRVSASEVARSVEKLLPELLTKSGDVTPRIHNMAAHTLLSMAESPAVRRLHIIPAHLSRPLTSTTHPRLALSRLEMVEQLILNHGISKDKKSGLACRTLAEFGSSGLHHPAEAVRKVSERILTHVYKVNPRIVRKQLPPDDSVTRRNLLYRQLFQAFDVMDMERKLTEQALDDSTTAVEANPPMLPPQRPEAHSKVQAGRTSEGPLQGTANRAVSFKAGVNADPTLPPQGANRDRRWAERPSLRRQLQEQGRWLGKAVESSGGDAAVKFPSLTDSIRATKARMSNEKCGLKAPSGECGVRKAQGGSPFLRDPVTRKVNSGIPVATFGTGRKLPMSSCKRAERPKATEGPPQTKIQQKGMRTSTPDPAGAKPETAEAAERGAGEETEVDKQSSIRFSESMLASIRENEFTMSSLFNGGEGNQEKLRTCIFCLSPKEWANEESLNRHYLKECLMLTTCEYCMEVTEISGLTNHLLDDCKWKTIFQKCARCHEAILGDLYSKHECSGTGSKAAKSRCPFCHESIGQGESSWRKHLMGTNTCPNHPRQK